MFPDFDGHMWESRDGGQTIWLEAKGGMTLRDWFAGQALAGILASDPEVAGFNPADGSRLIAKLAYEYADAMLAARES